MEKVALKNGVNKAVLGAKNASDFHRKGPNSGKIGKGWLVIQSGAKHITYMLWVNIFWTNLQDFDGKSVVSTGE